MPKLWNDTIDEHRQAVSEAILDKTAELVHAHGLTAVTMSRIAEETGIGRATLYKYFRDVEAIMVAWHSRLINAHLSGVISATNAGSNPRATLEAALLAYAGAVRVHHGTSLAAMLHAMPHARHAHAHLRDHVRKLIEAAVTIGQLRNDVPAAELADYALAALAAAEGISEPATRRLVGIVMAGMTVPSSGNASQLAS